MYMYVYYNVRAVLFRNVGDVPSLLHAIEYTVDEVKVIADRKLIEIGLWDMMIGYIHMYMYYSVLHHEVRLKFKIYM